MILHESSSKMFIFEIHIIFFFDHLDDFIKFVHVQLSDEGGQVSMSEKMG